MMSKTRSVFDKEIKLRAVQMSYGAQSIMARAAELGVRSKLVSADNSMRLAILLSLLLGCRCADSQPTTQNWVKWEDGLQRPDEVRELVIEREDSVGSDIAKFVNLERLFIPYGPSYISDSIASLQHLREFIGIDHEMQKFPTGLLHCKRLELLHLVSGPLDSLPEAISLLTQLKKVELRSNRLTTFPDQIVELKQLVELNAAFNHLDALPSSIGNLNSLETLHLPANRISALPSSIGHLKQLLTLNIASNNISIIDSSIYYLNRLQALDLGGNQISTISEEIGQMKDLVFLDLSHNQLNVLPIQLASLSSLTTLSLNHNQIRTIPEEVWCLPNLEYLNLSDNQITEIPSAECFGSKPMKLYLTGNPLSETSKARLREYPPTIEVVL